MCNHERFALHLTEDESGGLHFSGHANFQGTGVTSSGTRYTVTSESAGISEFGNPDAALTFTTISNFRFVRHGETSSPDDFLARGAGTFTFTPNGPVTGNVGNFEAECQ